MSKNLFVSNRNMNITSTQGYSIDFVKGEPTHVPPAMHAAAMERGAMPCDEKGETLDVAQSPVKEEPKILLAPEDADERNAKILEVVTALAKRNNPKDFSAGGVPRAASVSASLGWRVDQGEVTAVWRAHKAAILAQE